MKKLLVLGLLAGVGAVIFQRKKAASQAEQDLWTEATTAPDLR